MRSRQTLLAVVAGAGVVFIGVGALAQENDIPPPMDQPSTDQATNPPVVAPAAPSTECPPPTAADLPPPVLAPTYAQPTAAPPPPPAAPPPVRKHAYYGKHHNHNPWFDPRENILTAGAGVADYSFGPMRTATETGAEWDLRYTIGARSLVAFETGYMGTYNKMQSPVEGANSIAPYIVNNSVDSDLRLNLLPFRVQPYVFGGLGYNHASVSNLADAPGMATRFRTSDDQFLVPAGGGLALHVFKHTNIDARFTYRAIFKDSLDRDNPDSRLDQWVVTGRMGYTF